jgi:hypothetical protein
MRCRSALSALLLLAACHYDEGYVQRRVSEINALAASASPETRPKIAALAKELGAALAKIPAGSQRTAALDDLGRRANQRVEEAKRLLGEAETARQAASAKELGKYRLAFLGRWEGGGMTLSLGTDGMVFYRRAGKTITAPVSDFDRKSFKVGLLGITTTFRIDRPPHEEGGVTRMTIDGVELTRVGSAGPRAPGIAVCTRLDGDSCVDPSSELPSTVEKIQMAALCERAPGVGPSFLIAWIAEDVGEAAPPNHTIAETPVSLREEAAKAPSISLRASANRPAKGWPLGKYRVEVRSGGKTLLTARFRIVEPKP